CPPTDLARLPAARYQSHPENRAEGRTWRSSPFSKGRRRRGAEDDMVNRARGGAPVRALFIGNSFTARNHLPGLIAKLAAARGKSLEHHLISAGGASLRTHWNAGE